MCLVPEGCFKGSQSLGLLGIQLWRQKEGCFEHCSLVLGQRHRVHHLKSDVQVSLHIAELFHLQVLFAMDKANSKPLGSELAHCEY